MKRTKLFAIWLMVLCLGSAPAGAQARLDAGWDAAAPRLPNVGGFVGLDMRFGEIYGEFAAFVGAELAVLINRGVYLGLRGAGLATDNAHVPGSSPLDTLRMGYGGFVVGHILPVSSMLQVGVDVLIGAGTVGVDRAAARERDAVFVFEPSATFDLTLGSLARLGVGASYRFVGDASVAGVSDGSLRGFSGVIRLRFGKF